MRIKTAPSTFFPAALGAYIPLGVPNFVFGTLAMLLSVHVLGINARAGDYTTSAIGTSGSEFLTVDQGARGIAMAGAYSAATDDAYSMYWNPAGLARIPRMSATFMHNVYLADITLDYISYAQRINDISVLGGAIRYMDGGSISGTDINGNDLGSFHPRSYVYEVGYGQSIPDLSDADHEVFMGVTGRYFNTSMVKSADGFGGDFGTQFHYDHGRFPYTLSFVAQNMGRGQKFDATRDSMPFLMRTGGAINLAENILLAADAILPASNQPYGAFGTEYKLDPGRDLKLALRAGLNTQTLTNGLYGFRGLNFGFGLNAGNISFDYAFVPMGVLGNTHRFSVNFSLPSQNQKTGSMER